MRSKGGKAKIQIGRESFSRRENPKIAQGETLGTHANPITSRPVGPAETNLAEVAFVESSPSNPQNEAAQTARPPLRLGVLLSGRGSNFLAIANSIQTGNLQGIEIAVAISNVADAPGIQAARDLNLPTALYVSKGRPRADHDADLIACLRQHHVDLVCLAGYMRLLSPGFIAAFPNRILNIHPSLLPAFPGLDAQRQAFDYGVKVAGCTVHFVDEHLDHGAIILQRAIPVPEMDNDTDGAHRLADLILAEEHIAYPEAIARVASGEYEIRGRRYIRQK